MHQLLLLWSHQRVQKRRSLHLPTTTSTQPRRLSSRWSHPTHRTTSSNYWRTYFWHIRVHTRIQRRNGEFYVYEFMKIIKHICDILIHTLRFDFSPQCNNKYFLKFRSPVLENGLLVTFTHTWRFPRHTTAASWSPTEVTLSIQSHPTEHTHFHLGTLHCQISSSRYVLLQILIHNIKFFLYHILT